MTLWAEDGEVGVVLASEMAIVATVVARTAARRVAIGERLAESTLRQLPASVGI